MSNELVCAHKWGPPYSFQSFFAPDVVAPVFRLCDWCKNTWKDGDPEPRAVMMRIE